MSNECPHCGSNMVCKNCQQLIYDVDDFQTCDGCGTFACTFCCKEIGEQWLCETCSNEEAGDAGI